MQGRKIELRMKTPSQQHLEIRSEPQRVFNTGNVIPVLEKDYEKLKNKPQINGVELIGDKTTRQLGIEVTDPLTNLEIEAMFQSVFTEG